MSPKVLWPLLAGLGLVWVLWAATAAVECSTDAECMAACRAVGAEHCDDVMGPAPEGT